ncbi:RsfS/YbeB/iojap family protein [Kocuria rhizophila]|nr:RsfS/YbeB/iojap family protein [Kocuria rhizophila]
MTAAAESIALVRAAAAVADQEEGRTCVAFSVSESLAITDVFMVASAPNERQVSAVVDAVEERRRALLRPPPLAPREGKGEGRWGAVRLRRRRSIRVLHDEDRAFYALERLWGADPAIDVQLRRRSRSGRRRRRRHAGAQADASR